MWFGRSKIEDHDGKPTLLVPNQFSKDWIEKNYRQGLDLISNKIWNNKINLMVGKVEQKTAPFLGKVASNPSLNKAKPAAVKKINRHVEQNFSNFVCGEDNRLAFVASKTISRKDLSNSPFTLVGDHGTGKSHLAEAITSSWDPEEVLSVYAEEFTNDYIEASRTGQLEAFRRRIRSPKLIILEDLDFFLEGNKKKTIEELVQTLKVLKRGKTQIVVTSSAAVYKFESVSHALCQALLAGLRVKLSPPDLKCRKELIAQTLQKQKSKLSKSVIKFIEEIPFKSAMELLGAIKQLLAYSAIEKECLPVKVAREILSDHIRDKNFDSGSKDEWDLHSISQITGKQFGVQARKLVSSTRERHISLARHTAMALSYEVDHSTLKEIGLFYGGRSHQSVLFAVSKVTEKKKNDPNYRALFEELKAKIQTDKPG